MLKTAKTTRLLLITEMVTAKRGLFKDSRLTEFLQPRPGCKWLRNSTMIGLRVVSNGLMTAMRNRHEVRTRPKHEVTDFVAISEDEMGTNFTAI